LNFFDRLSLSVQLLDFTAIYSVYAAKRYCARKKKITRDIRLNLSSSHACDTHCYEEYPLTDGKRRKYDNRRQKRYSVNFFSPFNNGNYYQNNNCVERSYIGSDENLLKVCMRKLKVSFISLLNFYRNFMLYLKTSKN